MIWKSDVSKLIREVELRKPPVIITVNEFDEAAANKFIVDMSLAQNSGQPVIPVVIDSYGGQVYSLMRMVNAIKTSDIPVATIVEGKAMSCGVLLFSQGTPGYRYVSENATLMIHDVSSGSWGKNAEIQASADETKRLNEIVYEMLGEATGKGSHWFHKKINKKGRADWFVNPQQSLEMGLADHIGTPRLEIEIPVIYKFK